MGIALPRAAGLIISSAKPPKADTWGPTRTLDTADGMVYAVSADGNDIVIRPMAKAVTVLDMRTGKTRRIIGDFGGHLGSISYSPDGKLIAVAEWNNGASIRDAKTWDVIDRITPSGKHPVSMAAFTPDGKRVAFYCWTFRGGFPPADLTKPIVHADYQLMVWDVAVKKEIGWPAAARVGLPTVHFHEAIFTNRPFYFSREDTSTPNGLSASKTLTITDIAANGTSEPIALDKDDDKLFDITPDGKQILVMGAGRDPRLVDVATGRSGRSFGSHVRLITAAALSRDGKLVVTASGRQVDGITAAKLPGGWPPDVGPTELRIHNATTGEVLATYQSDTLCDYSYVGFSTDGKYVWAQTGDYQLMLWGQFPRLPESTKVIWPVDPNPPAAGWPGGTVRPGSSIDLPVSDALDKLVESLPNSGRPVEQQIEAVYLAALGRFATADELKRAAAALGNKPTAEKWKIVLDALVKSAEFEAHVKTLRKRVKLEPAFPTIKPQISPFSGGQPTFTPQISDSPVFPAKKP